MTATVRPMRCNLTIEPNIWSWQMPLNIRIFPQTDSPPTHHKLRRTVAMILLLLKQNFILVNIEVTSYNNIWFSYPYYIDQHICFAQLSSWSTCPDKYVTISLSSVGFSFVFLGKFCNDVTIAEGAAVNGDPPPPHGPSLILIRPSVSHSIVYWGLSTNTYYSIMVMAIFITIVSHYIWNNGNL